MELIIATILALLAVRIIASPGEDIPILKYENQGVNPDGSYKWSYETGNGISAQEEGVPKGPELLAAQGAYQYTSPDGTHISVVYVADENGFQPKGDSIPKSIQKALAWITGQQPKTDLLHSSIPKLAFLLPPRPPPPVAYPSIHPPYQPPAQILQLQGQVSGISSNAYTTILKGG